MPEPGTLRSGAKALMALRNNRIRTYRPYPQQLKFHALGKTHRERCLLAANQSGKSISAGGELTFHLTGEYPPDWPGRRYDRPVSCWISNSSFEQVRDNGQRLLLGEGGQEVFGTGLIPKRSLKDWTMSRSTSDCVDTVWVKHKSGGASYFKTKAYEQGRLKWQGWTGDIIWLDEEPPADIYSEAQTRLAVKQGMIMLTATPMMGTTEVVDMYYPEPKIALRALVQMTLADAEHYSEKERKELVESWPEHEREARGLGIPMAGEGLIFPVAESVFMIEPIEIPDWWPQLGGLDFGYDHPTAAVRMAFDPDTDTEYVVQDYALRKATPEVHAMTLNQWGNQWGKRWLRWTWPHDGHRIEDKDSDMSTAAVYRDLGLKLLPEHATFPDGSVGPDAGNNQILARMRTGRWKVFNTCRIYQAERRQYHKDKGHIVKKKDDVLSAARYAHMARRHARSPDHEGLVYPDTASMDYDPIRPRDRYQGESPRGRSPQREREIEIQYDPTGRSN